MTLEEYIKNREKRSGTAEIYRRLCQNCLQPDFGCYCKGLNPFDPKINFIILIHPIENRRRIATGRLSHLCLKNSKLLLGQNYSHQPTVLEIIKDPGLCSVVLYPGPNSINISHIKDPGRSTFVPKDKSLTVFVIDGTWATARKTINQSKNLRDLPRICFSPKKPSEFRVRQQPRSECVSTVEAIHQTIELIGPQCGFDTSTRQHDILLKTFNKMVSMKLSLIEENRRTGNLSRRRLGVQ